MNVPITCPDVANHVLIRLARMFVTVTRDIRWRIMASLAAVRFANFELNYLQLLYVHLSHLIANNLVHRSMLVKLKGTKSKRPN